MKKHIRQKEILTNLIEQLDSTFDLKERLRIATNSVLEALGSEMSSIMLKDDQERHLVIEYAQGLNQEVIRDTRVKIGEGISGWVAQQGKPLLIQDLSQDSRFSPLRPEKYYNNSLLSVPLRIKDEILGVINVNNKKTKGIFTQEDLEFLTQVAGHLARAIKNVRQLKELKSKSEMKEDMLANISHEMRNCLANIKEAIALLSEGIIGALNPKQAEVLTLAQNNIERLINLSNEFLDFAKMESGRIHLKRNLVNLVEVAQKALAMFKFALRKNKVQLEFKAPEYLPQIWADSERLTQVFTNLLGNALKFTPSGGEITVELIDAGEEIKAIVSDTGMGIYPEEQEKIFARFQQAETQKEELKRRGSGLGLAIVKEIIQLHQGKIWVDSQVGVGSKFIFTLPKDMRAA